MLIEAVIAEVSDQTASELGVQWQLPLNATIPNAHRSSAAPTSRPRRQQHHRPRRSNPLGRRQRLQSRLRRRHRHASARNTIFQLGALVTALRGDGKSNILSTPSILTLDNQEAEIKVAQEVPFLTGQYTTASTTANATTGGAISNPFQTIERKDVGLVLKVTPHINEGDSVRLNIHQEVSSLAPPVSGAVDLITNKREMHHQRAGAGRRAAGARRPDRRPGQGQRAEGAGAG